MLQQGGSGVWLLKWEMGCFGAYEASGSFRLWARVSAGAGTQKGASHGVGVMSVSSYCPVVEERRGRDNWKKVWEILVTDLIFRLLNITTVSFLRPVHPLPLWLPDTHLPYLRLLGFPDVYFLGLYLKLL